MKQRTCRFCKQKYTPAHSMQPCCNSFECKCAFAVEHAEKARKKRAQAERIAIQADRKIVRLQKEKLKTRADWMKEAQAAVNAYVRARDEKEPCISCGRHHEGQYHAGHYRSVGACPSLRFDLANINKQCSVCNNHLSGNLIAYRAGLIQKIGLTEVERLEGPQVPKKYSTDELKAIKALYVQKRKELQCASR